MRDGVSLIEKVMFKERFEYRGLLAKWLSGGWVFKAEESAARSSRGDLTCHLEEWETAQRGRTQWGWRGGEEPDVGLVSLRRTSAFALRDPYCSERGWPVIWITFENLWTPCLKQTGGGAEWRVGHLLGSCCRDPGEGCWWPGLGWRRPTRWGLVGFWISWLWSRCWRSRL